MIAAPRQHLTDEEKALIKEGKAADEIWPDEPAKANQKDIDARWTMKRGSLKRSEAGEAPAAVPAQIMVPMFGYKNHAGIDRTFGFIRKWAVTHAARHDSGAFEDVLDTGNIAQSVWADIEVHPERSFRSRPADAIECLPNDVALHEFSENRASMILSFDGIVTRTRAESRQKCLGVRAGVSVHLIFEKVEKISHIKALFEDRKRTIALALCAGIPLLKALRDGSVVGSLWEALWAYDSAYSRERALIRMP